MAKHKSDLSDRIAGTEDLVCLWSLRALSERLSVEKKANPLTNKPLKLFSDLGVDQERLSAAVDREALYKITSELLEKYVSDVPKIKKGTFEKNLKVIEDKFNFTHVELTILALLFLSNKDDVLREILDELGELSGAEAINLISAILDIKKDKVKAALDSDAKLIIFGFLKLNLWEQSSFLSKFTLFDALLDYLVANDSDLGCLATGFIRSPFSELKIGDYPHLLNDVDDLSIFLSAVCKSRQKGVNVLVYGPESSGKTQFLRALGDSLNLLMYENNFNTTKKESLENKLQTIVRAQSVFNSAECSVIMVDEMHCLFEIDRADFMSGPGNPMVKRFLRSNAFSENLIPTIWVSNRIDIFEYGDLSRVDYCLEFKKPSKFVREEFIKKKTVGLNVSLPWIGKIASRENISFELIDKLAKFTKTVCQSKPNSLAEQVFDNALSRSSLFIKGDAFDAANFAIDYQVELMNVDVDLSIVLESIKVCREARLCLYGPPGTGKSAYAYHLAKELDVPLIVKKGSDILGKYLGDSEKNLAYAFEEAKSKSGVLLIDEVDGLLADRSGAQRSWEISMVNELLTQIDCFKGILVVTTNFIEHLDAAAMRRFDLKVGFDYLKADQAIKLWDKCSEDFSLVNENFDVSKLAELKMLTPGDFSNIVRQSKFLPIRDSIDLYSRLKKEISHKNNSKNIQKIGFLANVHG